MGESGDDTMICLRAGENEGNDEEGREGLRM
jgi:hypothetical protein